MTTPSSLAQSLEVLRNDPEALIQIILGQAEQIQRLQAEISSLKQQIEELSQRPPGSVAPFRVSDEKKRSRPKSPGRAKGHPGHFRQARAITEQIEVSLPCCPACGQVLEEVRAVRQIIEELPAPALRIVELTTYQGDCASCGRVRSRHPLQVSRAEGAAGVHLGPRALSVAMQLQHQWHLTKRKTCAVLRELFDLSLTPGGLVAATHRLAAALQPEEQALVQQIRQARVLHADETGWYVGAPGATLWVFTHPQATLYRVVMQRTRHQLQTIIGEHFPGVLVSDCLSIYDEASPHQQKCYSHHLKALSQAIQKHPDQGTGFLKQLQLLLRSALVLHSSYPDMPTETFQKIREALQTQMHHLLAQPRGQPEEEAIRQRLSKQQDHLWTFLQHPEVPATNNLAERQLRPAVIARKISCGNRTFKGARSWEIMASLALTCQQIGDSLAGLLQHALIRRLNLAFGR